MDFLNLSDITFKYKDDEGVVRETDMYKIMIELGFEYSVPDDVFKLRSYRGMLEIKIRNKIVWESFEDGTIPGPVTYKMDSKPDVLE